ncbi:MAG: adenylosuccinate lyase [Albidovulum sp.]|nr:adenylosuccinate lyase [Albidovulum sp.]MDE0532379.1 adenylosuccinate lyase [Albidovulum sp.]
MISRYSRPQMAKIWSDSEKYKIWYSIEAAASEAMAQLGQIPEEDAAAIRRIDTDFDLARVKEIERETKHDVIAFLTYLAEKSGTNSSRSLHRGMTSSDVVDTCFNIQLSRAADLLLEDLRALLEALKERAFDYKYTVCVGRSHGVHAEPTTFGLKLAQAYAEMARNQSRLATAKQEISTGAISGAVGTFATVDPRVEEHVCRKFGLRPEPISTQVIPRDRHAMFFAVLSIIAASAERLAVEFRNLQRTEILEIEESFSSGQKGSSAMPHKKNPILSENLTGLARLIRSYSAPAMENVVLWHERDISHSSVERVIAPDATIALDFALARLTTVVRQCVVRHDNMKKNLSRLNGLVHSQNVLLSLTDMGISREAAYSAVQRVAMTTWNTGLDFKQALQTDEFVSSVLDISELEDCFEIDRHLAHIDQIFERVFKS